MFPPSGKLKCAWNSMPVMKRWILENSNLDDGVSHPNRIYTLTNLGFLPQFISYTGYFQMQFSLLLQTCMSCVTDGHQAVPTCSFQQSSQPFPPGQPALCKKTGSDALSVGQVPCKKVRPFNESSRRWPSTSWREKWRLEHLALLRSQCHQQWPPAASRSLPCSIVSTSGARAAGGLGPSHVGSSWAAPASFHMGFSPLLPAAPPPNLHSCCHQRNWKSNWQRPLCPKQTIVSIQWQQTLLRLKRGVFFHLLPLLPAVSWWMSFLTVPQMARWAKTWRLRTARGPSKRHQGCLNSSRY